MQVRSRGLIFSPLFLPPFFCLHLTFRSEYLALVDFISSILMYADTCSLSQAKISPRSDALPSISYRCLPHLCTCLDLCRGFLFLYFYKDLSCNPLIAITLSLLRFFAPYSSHGLGGRKNQEKKKENFKTLKNLPFKIMTR